MMSPISSADGQLTSSSASKEAQAQSASIQLTGSSFDDSGHLHFDSLHHGFYALSFQGFRIIQTRMMVLSVSPSWS